MMMSGPAPCSSEAGRPSHSSNPFITWWLHHLGKAAKATQSVPFLAMYASNQATWHVLVHLKSCMQFTHCFCPYISQ
jgi:hypothetical protein